MDQKQKTIKLQSWNVNGLRAVIRKNNFTEYFDGNEADFICMQEIKAYPDQVEFDFSPYKAFWHNAERRGYSGTLTLAKEDPLSVSRSMGNEEFDSEGRVLTLEYPGFYLVNVYSPNSQNELARLDGRMEFEELFRDYLLGLKAAKSVIVCGDLNVAHKEIDLKNPVPIAAMPTSPMRSGEVWQITGFRFHRYFQIFLPRCRRRLHLVELHYQG